MQRLYFIFLTIFYSAILSAQVPNKMTYQAIVRNSSNTIVVNSQIGARISILTGGISGVVVFSETHTVNTNSNGLISIEIGNGLIVSGDLSLIDWSSGPFYLKTEIDPLGGSNYTIVGATEFLSVPYAFHANSSNRSSGFIVNNAGLNLDPSAGLEVNFGDKGFLLPRVADTNAITSPAEGLQIYDLNSHCLRYRSNVAWSGCLMTSNGQIGYTPVNTIGCNSSQSEAAYGTVVNVPGATGLTWITRNLGAVSQATGATDGADASAGCYFQFNRAQPFGNDFADGTSTLYPAWTISMIDENSDWLISNDPCRLQLGGQWRIPTSTEWTNVDAAGGWATDVQAYSSLLKLHNAGALDHNNSGNLYGRGTFGAYWSSSQQSNYDARILDIYDTNSFLYPQAYKSHGFSLRCVK